jgi:hypothetical protein
MRQSEKPVFVMTGKQTRSSLPTQDSSLDTDQIFSPVPEPPSGMINLSSGVTQLPASYYSPYHRQMDNNYPFQTDETAIRKKLYIF